MIMKKDNFVAFSFKNRRFCASISTNMAKLINKLTKNMNLYKIKGKKKNAKN